MTYYYLDSGEVSHYQYMLDRGYQQSRVTVRNHEFVVFRVVDKDVWIAWPVEIGKLDGDNLPPIVLFKSVPELRDEVLIGLGETDVSSVIFPAVTIGGLL